MAFHVSQTKMGRNSVGTESFLEHGVQLNLVGDQHPEAHIK